MSVAFERPKDALAAEKTRPEPEAAAEPPLDVPVRAKVPLSRLKDGAATKRPVPVALVPVRLRPGVVWGVVVAPLLIEGVVTLVTPFKLKFKPTAPVETPLATTTRLFFHAP